MNAGTLTSNMDNAQLDPALVAAADVVFARDIDQWQRAGAEGQGLAHSNKDLNGLADSIYAFAHLDGQDFFVLENDWSGFPDPSQYMLVGLSGPGQFSALAYFEDWPANWAQPSTAHKRDPKQSLLEMAHKAGEQSQSGPTDTKRLAVAGGMAFVKGGVVSAILVAPFFGIATAVATASAFSLFCIGLALWRGPKHSPTT